MSNFFKYNKNTKTTSNDLIFLLPSLLKQKDLLSLYLSDSFQI